MHLGPSPRCVSSAGPGVWIVVSIGGRISRAVGEPSSRLWCRFDPHDWSLSSSTPRPGISGAGRSANSTRSFGPCPVPTTPCSHSSTLPMKSCAPPDTSIGRSVKPRSMTIPGPAQSAPKKIRLSALRNTGSNQPRHCPQAARPPDPDRLARMTVRPWSWEWGCWREFHHWRAGLSPDHARRLAGDQPPNLTGSRYSRRIWNGMSGLSAATAQRQFGTRRSLPSGSPTSRQHPCVKQPRDLAAGLHSALRRRRMPAVPGGTAQWWVADRRRR